MEKDELIIFKNNGLSTTKILSGLTLVSLIIGLFLILPLGMILYKGLGNFYYVGPLHIPDSVIIFFIPVFLKNT